MKNLAPLSPSCLGLLPFRRLARRNNSSPRRSKRQTSAWSISGRPWCSNCQAELKSGGWLKTVKTNPEVKFYFVSVWNGGEDGRAMLAKYELANQPNVTILADPGPRNGDGQDQAFPRPALELDPGDLGL